MLGPGAAAARRTSSKSRILAAPGSPDIWRRVHASRDRARRDRRPRAARPAPASGAPRRRTTTAGLPGRWRRPARTPPRGTVRRRSRCPRSPQHLVDHGPQLVGTGRVGHARRRPAPPARCRWPASNSRATPDGSAYTQVRQEVRAATGSRRASRPVSPTRPRRWPRCPRSRRGAAAGRRPRSRRRRAPPHQQRGRAVGGLADSSRVRAAGERLEEVAPGRHRPVVHPIRHACRLRRMRWSLTGNAVPRCCAHSETRYSSSIQRTCRRCSPGGGRPAARPSGAGRRPAGRRSGPAAAGRGRSGRAAARDAAPGRRGTSGSGAAGRARPRRRTRGDTSRPSWPRMSVSAGSMAMSARPLSAFSARRHASSTRSTSASTLRSAPPGPDATASRRATYAAWSRTARPRVHGARPRRRRGSRPSGSATVGYGDPARPSFSALVRPSRTRSTGSIELEQQQPAYAEPMPRLGLVLGAEHLQADRGALVDQGGVAAHLVSGPGLRERRLDRAEGPGSSGRCGRCRCRTPPRRWPWRGSAAAAP